MASVFGQDGGTYTDGRKRRPTNAGYPYGSATPAAAPSTSTAVPRGTVPGGGASPFGDPFGDGGTRRTGTGTAVPRGSQGPLGERPDVDPDPNTDTAPAPTPAPPAPAPRKYGTIAGLDTKKLQDEAYHSYKYGDAARAFSSFVGGGGKVGRDALDDLVKYAQDTFGLKSAHAVGDDKIDFGDGSGPIDLILSDGGLWWGQEGPGGSADPFTTSAGGGLPYSPDAFPGMPPGTVANNGMGDMSWLAELLKTFAPKPAAAAPPVVVNVPGQQPSASYSQPSPSFGGGYVSPGFAPTGDGMMDATSLLSLALPRLLQDPDALSNPLVRQILQMTQGGRR